jgi:glyoxylase-like metal-dependent hydrolase (beta-lactamase superfamily II)
MPMDYFVWLVRNTHRAVVIDVDLRRKAGASGAGAWNAVRSTPWRFCGVDPAVEGVILTHMHYDHVGNFDKPP